jgi:hypothetical protein
LKSRIEITENFGQVIGFKLHGLSVVTSNNPEIDYPKGNNFGWSIQNSYSKLAIILFFEGTKVHNFNVSQEMLMKLRNVIIFDEIVQI